VVAARSLTLLPIQAAHTSIMGYCHHTTLPICKMPDHKPFTVHWCSFSEHGSNCVTLCLAYKGCQYVDYAQQWANHCPITLLTIPKIDDALLTLIYDGSHIVTNNYANNGGYYIDYGLLPLHSLWNIKDTRKKIVYALLSSVYISKM